MPKSAEEIIAETLADGRTAGWDGIPRVGRGTRKKAQAIISALESAGYVIEKGWRSITVTPDRPMDVLMFYGHPNCYRDYRTGEPITDIPVGCRYNVGYWDGLRWRDHGTNHDEFEFGSKVGDEDVPTHWCPLPARPQDPS